MQTESLDNFCIDPDYRTASGIIEPDQTSNYDWSEGRVKSSVYYQYHVYQEALKLIMTSKLGSVIDIGCGPGVKLMEMLNPAGIDAVGIDQKEAIQICTSRYPEGEFYVDNFDSPSLSLDRTFDLIICADVIEHVANPDLLLSYVRDHAHLGSHIILSTPERDRLRGKGCAFSPKREHIREWNSQEFVNYLESRSLVIEEHRIVPKLKWNLKEYYKMLKRPLKFRGQLMSCQMAICRLAD